MPPFSLFPNLSSTVATTSTTSTTLMDTITTSADPMDLTSQKRKRSSSIELSSQPPPGKSQKLLSSHLQINYLARLYTDTLPLIHAENDLPTLLHLIAEYDGVLHRHESLAGNMGARPLGPILIQRFDRLFDGPPRILKTHAKDGGTVGWLDVVEFARNKPEQFNLEKSRDGVRVCQFYTKQCRVEISEDDFLLINSGMPQKLIPPQPISEDEEKELGTLEILEKRLAQVVQAADQVSAKARQLNHRLKNRKAAIITRRENEKIGAAPSLERSESTRVNGAQPSASPPGGFVAVNSKAQSNGTSRADEHRASSTPAANGYSWPGASASTREDLLRNFQTNKERNTLTSELERRVAGSRNSLPPKARSRFSADQLDYAGFLNAAASPVAIPNTPSNLMPHVKPSVSERYDDSGPYKADMMLRMEQLNRGDRVMPPCDRCRRLHMDCLKNLTACMGCTKKHAKCSWKEVEEQELRDHPFVPRVVLEGKDKDSGEENKDTPKPDKKKDWGRESVGVRDEELLGESSEEEDLDDASDVPTCPPPPPREEPGYGTKSHSPPTDTAAVDPRNGAKSAPATDDRPLSPPTNRTSSALASSVPPLTPHMRRPEIPIYRPPKDNTSRVFTAHEWDSYTRHPLAVSNPRAAPSSDIHDELKSAALEAERELQTHEEEGHIVKYEHEQKRERARENETKREKERRGNGNQVRVFAEGKEPMVAATKAVTDKSAVYGLDGASERENEVGRGRDWPLEVEKEKGIDVQQQKEALSAPKDNGRPTPPPERLQLPLQPEIGELRNVASETTNVSEAREAEQKIEPTSSSESQREVLEV